MELNIKPHHQNSYLIGGIWVRGHSLDGWLTAIQQLGLALESVHIYPLPGTTANSVWGCLLELPAGKLPHDIGPHTYCQLAHNLLFLPTNAILYPLLPAAELQQLLGGERYCFHPSIGWVQLGEPLDCSTHIQLPNQRPLAIQKPAQGIFLPQQVKNFQVHQPPVEEVLEQMDSQSFPQSEELKDKPLNLLEKIKLGLLRSLFAPKGDSGKYASSEGGRPRKWLEKMAERLGGKAMNNLTERLQQQYEDLEQRNQKAMDKLLDMFKNNPDEALKYAIPIDEEGTGRGGYNQSFDLSRRWDSFSLFGNRGSWGSGCSVSLGDSQMRSLIDQYHDTAEQLIKKKDYTKAAFVYLKLLKNPHKAADTLKEGQLYGEAAAIYIKHCNNLRAAADCYEQGRMTQQAIELYQQVGDDEKVGDLYISLNDKPNAYRHYTKVTDEYEQAHQFVKAALIHKNKMHDTEKAQYLLLHGWRLGADASSCLNNYFSNITDETDLAKSIDRVFQDDTSSDNEMKLLQVLKHQYGRGPLVAEHTRDIAYQIISQQAVGNPDVVSELKHFNPSDKKLVKDVLKYKQGRRMGGR
jgi:hypothetical protein